MSVIRIRPTHICLGGALGPEYLVTCSCGWRERAWEAPTHAGRKREATNLAMEHNTMHHGYEYEIQGGSS